MPAANFVAVARSCAELAQERERLLSEHAVAVAVAAEAVDARKEAEKKAAAELAARLSEADERFAEVARERDVAVGQLTEHLRTSSRKAKVAEAAAAERTALLSQALEAS